MVHSQITEEIALILILVQLQDYGPKRFDHHDLSMESVIKKEAMNRGVDYRTLLPYKLAEMVKEVIQKALGDEFEFFCTQFPEAILWEANRLVYGGDTSLLDHKAAASYLKRKGIRYTAPVMKFPAPEDEIKAIKKAIFDH